MRLSTLATSLALAANGFGAITWTLDRASDPTPDQEDAYERIADAMTRAVDRHSRLSSNAAKNLWIVYDPSIPTASGNYNGNIRFGSNRAVMDEQTALHEISHTLGIGTSGSFDPKCSSNDWKTATPLLQSWDGSGAKINCDGSHIWPYGLNSDSEFNEQAADRHVQLISAMLDDGL